MRKTETEVVLIAFSFVFLSVFTLSGNKLVIEDFNSTHNSTAENSQISFEAALHNRTVTSNSPGVIQFSLENDGEPVNATTPGFYPFGAPWAQHQNSNTELLLWNKDYKNEDNYVAVGENSMGVQNIGLRKELGRDQTFRRNYSIMKGESPFGTEWPTKTGRYTIEESITYSKPNSTESEEFQYEVNFTLEKQNRLARFLDQ